MLFLTFLYFDFFLSIYWSLVPALGTYPNLRGKPARKTAYLSDLRTPTNRTYLNSLLQYLPLTHLTPPLRRIGMFLGDLAYKDSPAISW